MKKGDQTTTKGVARVPDAALVHKLCITKIWSVCRRKCAVLRTKKTREEGRGSLNKSIRCHTAEQKSTEVGRKEQNSNSSWRIPKHWWTGVNLRLCIFHSAGTVSKTSGCGDCIILDCREYWVLKGWMPLILFHFITEESASNFSTCVIA